MALVHDHLVQDGGAERVLKAMQRVWPEAPIFTLLYDERGMSGYANGGVVRTSFLAKFPFASRFYRWMLPFMPAATETYDLRGFDVVISNTSAFAKGVITSPETLHVSYCHTPPRYLWSDTHEYVDYATPFLVRPFMPLVTSYLRGCDQRAAERVDVFLTNSKTVTGRIRKYYRKEAQVVYPPVDVEMMKVGERAEGLYVVAGGRLVQYKRYDLIIEACGALGLPLVIFGEGPELGRLRRMAGANVQFVGRVSDEEKARLYAGALAYVHPQEEDFGITAVEAMACGTPVIAYRRGGATETVIDGVTGVFFEEQSATALRGVLRRFLRAPAMSRDAMRTQAEKFREEVFMDEIRKIVEEAYYAYRR